MGFYRIDRNDRQANIEAGNAIIEVSNSVFKPGRKSAWVPFVTNTKKWIFDHHYEYCNDDGTLFPAQAGRPVGYTPDDVELVPVYDSEKRMHVRVPFHGAVTGIEAAQVLPAEDYTGGFPVVLARYFMRSCR